jgi:hypothetical protein
MKTKKEKVFRSNLGVSGRHQMNVIESFEKEKKKEMRANRIRRAR